MRPYLVELPEVQIDPAGFKGVKPLTSISGLVLKTLNPHIFSTGGIVLAEIKIAECGTSVGGKIGSPGKGPAKTWAGCYSSVG